MRKSVISFLSWSCNLFLLTSLLVGCQEEAIPWESNSKDLVITDYVAQTPGFSELEKILDHTGLNSLLAVRGPFTVFLPGDEAMKNYYTEKGVADYTGLGMDELNRFVLNLLVPSLLETGDFGLGSIRDPNALGDYLVTEFDGADIIVNKRSKIIKRNIPAANGVIHIIDRAIDPVTKSVFEVLSENPAYSIFVEALARTHLKDTLLINEFPFGSKMARTRFTILAIADTTFNRFNIYSVEDLIARYTNAPDSITHLQNGFFRYMEYHCLGETYFLNGLETKIYPILSYDNNISVTVDTDYKLNFDATTKNYTGFVVDQSNIPARNGAVHTINGLLPVFEPKPTIITWETTDHFDLKLGDYFGKHYARWFDGQNTFANIKWNGDYLLYYYKNKNTGYNLNYDCLSMNGWWWLQVKTKKIMKGKYKITSNCWGGTNYAVYVDGVNSAQIKSSDVNMSVSWGEFNWETTTAHTFKVVTLSPGLVFWDTIIFTPIN